MCNFKQLKDNYQSFSTNTDEGTQLNFELELGSWFLQYVFKSDNAAKFVKKELLDDLLKNKNQNPTTYCHAMQKTIALSAKYNLLYKKCDESILLWDAFFKQISSVQTENEDKINMLSCLKTNLEGSIHDTSRKLITQRIQQLTKMDSVKKLLPNIKITVL